MKIQIYIAVSLLAIFFLGACKKEEPQIDNTPKTILLSKLGEEAVYKSNEFGVNLFAHVARKESGNMMLSPLSASVALTMLLNGTRENTFREINNMLGYPEDWSLQDVNDAYKSLVQQLLQADPSVQLNLANGIFYRAGYPIHPDFFNSMESNFNALVKGLDFDQADAVNQINQWASDKTNGRIPVVLDQISAQTVMLIMNALYFKGKWTIPFKKSNTAPGAFTLSGGNTIQVPFMDGEVSAKAVHSNKVSILEIPYGRRNFSMVFMMPDEGLDSWLQNFHADEWRTSMELLGNQEDDWRNIFVKIPSFSFDYEKVLNEALESLGMRLAFTEEADLSGISDNRLQVSEVKQNTFIEVNEEGTEAAAVTTIDIIETSFMEWKADKPFVFAIRERSSNTLLFIGMVQDPSR